MQITEFQCPICGSNNLESDNETLPSNGHCADCTVAMIIADEGVTVTGDIPSGY